MQAISPRRVALSGMLGLSVLLACPAGASEAPIHLRRWGSFGYGPGQFSHVRDLALSPQGTLFVVDRTRIQSFDLDGTFRGAWGSVGSGPGQFGSAPGCIGTDGSGNLYATDYDNDRVQKFYANGSFLASWAVPDAGDVAVDAAGVIYVSCGGRVVRIYSPDLQSLGSWPTNPGLADPMSIAIDPTGDVWMTYPTAVEKYTPDGVLLLTLGAGGSNGEFDFPQGIAFDDAGIVHVSDRRNGRIRMFDASGTHLGDWGLTPPGTICEPVHDGVVCEPWGIVMHGNERIVGNTAWCSVDVYGFPPTPAVPGSWGSVKARYR